MKAFIAEAPMKAAFHEVGIPILKPDEVLIKIKYAGICGTDYAIYSGNSCFIKNGRIKYPVRFGHEWSGIVAGTGSAVRGFAIGDKVVGDTFVACGKCKKCIEGLFDECTQKHHVGTIDCWDGCFAEYMVMPQRHLYHLPERLSLMEAALMEPLSIAYGGIKKCSITSQSTVVVIGTGSIGMSVVALAKFKGAKQIIMVGRNRAKLEIARKIGATQIIHTKESDARQRVMELTNGNGADYILEASGALDSIMQSINFVAQKGFIAILGFYESNIDNVDMDLLVSKQVTITGIMGEYGNMQEINQIASYHDFGLTPIITKTIGFEDCPMEFRIALREQDNRIKTVIAMPD